jgi:hypothetical protein
MPLSDRSVSITFLLRQREQHGGGKKKKNICKQNKDANHVIDTSFAHESHFQPLCYFGRRDIEPIKIIPVHPQKNDRIIPVLVPLEGRNNTTFSTSRCYFWLFFSKFFSLSCSGAACGAKHEQGKGKEDKAEAKKELEQACSSYCSLSPPTRRTRLRPGW